MRVLATAFLAASFAFAQQGQSSLTDRVGTFGFIQVEADGFRQLPPKQQALAYWLAQAAIAIDPINYDQNSRFGLRQKRLLEGSVAHPQGIERAAMDKILAYTKLFWANRGNHNYITAQKFVPEFTFEQLKAAATQALKNGAAIGPQPRLDQELNDLRPSLFDPNFEPMMTAKTPEGGKDILQASSNNFYSNVSVADLKTFTEKYALNSRLVKENGKLFEEVYRAGTPDGAVRPGRGAEYLKKATEFLDKARAYATPAQSEVIARLIKFYQTGEFSDWLAFGAAWVGNNEAVDFANGFIEVYRDARGAKGTSQAFVSVTDRTLDSKMAKLVQNAQYFEEHAPWAQQYKKQGVQPPAAKVVYMVAQTGDFHVNTVGDNLPNEREIREKYGTKSFIIFSNSHAINRATGQRSLKEFAYTPEELELGTKYAEEANDMLVTLHEVIGHGSGKLNPKLTHDFSYYLKEYASTLEEARADLMALWNIWDPKIKELGLVSNQEAVAKAMYMRSARDPLLQLRSNPKGETLEEDHQRDRQLIVNYIIDTTHAIEQVTKDGKTYMVVKDFQAMRKGVGALLAELMRIKAEGDYEAIKALVNKYGVHFDPKLRDQVIERYKKLDLPTYWAGINADLTPTLDSKGNVTSVAISYPRDFVKQQLRYSAMYK
jgi:dipeptidyl-peptidase-3